MCHAKQLLLSYGVPVENIILFMANDVATSQDNPFSGRLYNAPTPAGAAGVDVYSGCYDSLQGYYGENVTAANFLSALTGTPTGIGPVLASTSRSKVFINLVDHGGAGLFAFPYDLLYADQLADALALMSARNMYRELVFFLESCESGSMLQGLPRNSSVYALSASSPTESSWGIFCPGEGAGDSVNGTELDTCLGDLFSITWMSVLQANCSSSSSSSPGEPLCGQSLRENFQLTSARVNLSSVMAWGDPSFQDSAIGGWVTDGQWPFPPTGAPPPSPYPPTLHAISSRNASRASLQRRLTLNPSSPALLAELSELSAREARQARGMDTLRARTPPHAAAAAAGSPALTGSGWACYRRLVGTFEGLFGRLSDYTLLYAAELQRACQELPVQQHLNLSALFV